MLDRVPLLEKHLATTSGWSASTSSTRSCELAEPLPGRAGAARQRHRLRRRRRRAARHPRAAAPQRRHRRRLAGHARAATSSSPSPRPSTTALQGADIEWTPEMQRIYLEKVLDNALLLDGHYDFVVMHDPQPAALLSFLRERLGVADAGHRPGSGGATSTSPRPTRRSGSSSARSSSCTTPRSGPCPSSCPSVARHGARGAGAAVHRPAVGEEPRTGDAVLPGARQAVRRRRASPDRLPGEPVRPVEGPRRRDRGVPHRARACPRRAARARGLDGHRRPRGVQGVGRHRGRARRRPRHLPACRTSTRWARCRSNAFQRIAQRRPAEVAARRLRPHRERRRSGRAGR